MQTSDGMMTMRQRAPDHDLRSARHAAAPMVQYPAQCPPSCLSPWIAANFSEQSVASSQVQEDVGGPGARPAFHGCVWPATTGRRRIRPPVAAVNPDRLRCHSADGRIGKRSLAAVVEYFDDFAVSENFRDIAHPFRRRRRDPEAGSGASCAAGTKSILRSSRLTAATCTRSRSPRR